MPYKGSAEVVQGLLTGSVDFIVDGIAPSLPLIKSGQFRALAKLNNRPLPPLPDLQAAVGRRRPAAARRNVELDRAGRAGRHAAARSSQKIHDDVVSAYADPAVADRLEKAGIIAVTTTPAEFDAFFRDEAERWTKVYKESGIKLD